MPRICHVTSAHARHDPRIFVKQCSTLADAGYDVTLLVNDDLGNEVVNGVVNGVVIVSTGRKPRNRWIRFFRSRVALWDLVKKIDADVYQFHDPDLLPIAFKLKRRFGKKVIFDFHENTERQILDKDWIPGPLRPMIAPIYGSYERRVASRCDAIITVTPELVEKMSALNENTVMITNYPIVDSSSESMQERRGTRTVCFAGGITPQWNHDKVIQAIDRIDVLVTCSTEMVRQIMWRICADFRDGGR